MTHIATIEKWDDSLAVRVPNALAAKVGLAVGTRVKISEMNGSLFIRKMPRRSRYKLSDLLRSCTGEPHPDMWSKPVGNELI